MVEKRHRIWVKGVFPEGATEGRNSYFFVGEVETMTKTLINFGPGERGETVKRGSFKKIKERERKKKQENVLFTSIQK